MACLTNFCATNFPPSTSVPRTYWHSSKFYWRWFGICSNIFSLYELYSRFMTKRHLNSLTRIISYCDCNYKVILWPFSILSERFLRVFFLAWFGVGLQYNMFYQEKMLSHRKATLWKKQQRHPKIFTLVSMLCRLTAVGFFCCSILQGWCELYRTKRLFFYYSVRIA